MSDFWKIFSWTDVLALISATIMFIWLVYNDWKKSNNKMTEDEDALVDAHIELFTILSSLANGKITADQAISRFNELYPTYKEGEHDNI